MCVSVCVCVCMRERERERVDPNNFPLEIISINPPTGEVECYQALSNLEKLIS